jgi:hypothetical protein
MMNKIRAAKFVEIALVIFTLFLTSCATEPIALQNSDHLIVPGERVGPIKLGMTEQEVFNLLGPAKKHFFRFGTLIYSWEDGDFEINVSPDNHTVYVVKVFSPSYHTAEGVRVGSSEFDLVHLKGLPQWKDDARGTAKTYSAVYNNNSILFSFYSQRMGVTDFIQGIALCRRCTNDLP